MNSSLPSLPSLNEDIDEIMANKIADLEKQLRERDDIIFSQLKLINDQKNKILKTQNDYEDDFEDFETNEDTMKPKRPRKSRMSIKVQDRACPSCGRKMPYERLMNHSTTCIGGYTNNNKFNALGQCSTCSRIVLPRERVHHVCEIFMPK